MLELKPMPISRTQSGFTLVEMMVTVAVLAIVLTIGIPQFQNIIQGNRATSIANDLLGHLQLARSEAVRRARTITFCPSNDGQNCSGSDWSIGWLLVADRGGSEELVLRVAPALRSGAVLSNGPAEIIFTAVGTTANTTTFTLTVGSQSREICVEASGRSAVEDCT